jgi:hypothetical protein
MRERQTLGINPSGDCFQTHGLNAGVEAHNDEEESIQSTLFHGSDVSLHRTSPGSDLQNTASKKLPWLHWNKDLGLTRPELSKVQMTKETPSKQSRGP